MHLHGRWQTNRLDDFPDYFVWIVHSKTARKQLEQVMCEEVQESLRMQRRFEFQFLLQSFPNFPDYYVWRRTHFGVLVCEEKKHSNSNFLHVSCGLVSHASKLLSFRAPICWVSGQIVRSELLGCRGCVCFALDAFSNYQRAELNGVKVQISLHVG